MIINIYNGFCFSSIFINFASIIIFFHYCAEKILFYDEFVMINLNDFC